MYSEYEQDFIDALREKIGPKHPLYNQEVYAIAVRRNPGAVLYQAFNDGFYAIVYFSQSFTPPPPIAWRLTGLASLAGATNWGLA